MKSTKTHPQNDIGSMGSYMGPICKRIGNDVRSLPMRGTVSAQQAAHILTQETALRPIVVLDCPPWKGKPQHKIVVC